MVGRSTEARDSRTERIVVTGAGAISPYGVGLETLWEGLLAGRPAFAPVDRWSLPTLGPQSLALIPAVDVKIWLPRLRPPLPSRYSQLALIAAAKAIENAQWDPAATDPTRTGTLLNTDFGPGESAERYITGLLTEGPETASPLLFSRSVANVALGDVARYFRLRGASSLVIAENVMTYAFDLLRAGRADLLVCVGVDELREPMVWAYSGRGLMSSPEDAQANTCLPYESGSNGMMLGESAVAVVLERLDHAARRGATVYAEMRGYATRRTQGDAFDLSKRSADDFAYVMRKAILRAGLSTDAIGLIMGAASSHPRLGAAELQAVANVWPDDGVKLTSPKAGLGETFGSSAALGFAAASLAIESGLAPPAGRSDRPDQSPAMVIRGSPSEFMPCACVVNSIHIGGNQTSLVLVPCPSEDLDHVA